MLISKRQLRRLIESAIYEQNAPEEIDNDETSGKLKSKMKSTADAKKGAQKSIKSKISSGGKQVIPKEVRAELKKLRLDGYTSLAFDKEGVNGLSILLLSDEKARDLALKRLKSIYGEDSVTLGSTERLQGGSAGIKDFDGKRLQTTGFKLGDDLIRRKVQSKEDLEQMFAGGDDIFIKMEKPKKASQPAGTISEQFRTFSDLAGDMLNESSAQNLDRVQHAAIDLYDAMDGMGTDEGDIREIFQSMRGDINTLRKVAYLYGAISRGGSLYEDLLSEMGEGDIKQYVEQSFPGAMDILSR